MKILQLCKKFPYPLKDGESIANTYLSKSLNELGCSVTLLAMNTTKHYVDVESLPEDFDHYDEVHHVKIDNAISYVEAFKYLFRSKSYQIARFVHKDFKQKLKAILMDQTFDVVQIESIYLTPYIPTIRKYSKALVAMRAHNIENEIWQRMHANLHIGPKKWYLRHHAKRLRQFEEQQMKHYDLLITLTRRDLKAYRDMGYHNGAIMSPIGLQLTDYQNTQNRPSKYGISFIGALDWLPNQEGLIWFIEKVWPTVQECYPKAHFHAAGRNMPESFQQYHRDRVNMHGEIEDALSFMNGHPIMVVPLFSGSGMRVKILEGMALGKVVITTSIGLEGIHATHGKEVLVADTKEEFIEQINYCFTHPMVMDHIGQAAKSFIDHSFDSRQIASELYQKYLEEIEHHRDSVPAE